MRVKDKSIIVTGSGGGIGEGIAKRLAAEGAQVIVNDINPRPRREGGGQIIRRAGGRASFFAADVTQSADVKALVEAAVQRHGKLDVMVNNAGWTHRNRPALEVSEDEFDQCFAVNMKSIYLSTIHAVPALPRQQGRQLHQHRLHRRRAAAPRPHLVQRLQGRGDHHQQVAGGRVRPGQHPRELHQPGVQPRHRACRPSSPAARWTRSAAPNSSPPSRWAASRPRSTSPMPRCTWPATRPPSSRASASRWTAPAASDPGLLPGSCGDNQAPWPNACIPLHRPARSARWPPARPRIAVAGHRVCCRDTLGRPLRDLRISVTDRCNFRCSYCMPKEVFDKDYQYLPHCVAADLRGDHAPGAAVRRARRAQDPPDRRRAAAAQEHRGPDRAAGRAAHAWTASRSTSRSPPTARCSRARPRR